VLPLRNAVHHTVHVGVADDVPDGLAPLSTELGTAVSPDAWELDALRTDHGSQFPYRSNTARTSGKFRPAGAPEPIMTELDAPVVTGLERHGPICGVPGVAASRQRCSAASPTSCSGCTRQQHPVTALVGLGHAAAGNEPGRREITKVWPHSDVGSS
jgi:hypothetical protein